MPILGILASAQPGNIVTGSYESIATITPSGVSTFSFNSIPSTYKHLQIRYITENSNAAYYVLATFNSDTSANYPYHLMAGSGSSLTSDGGTAITNLNLPRNAVTNPFYGAGIMDILDYQNTNKYKTVRSFGGYTQNGTGQYVDFNSGVWGNTNAITSIQFSVLAGTYTGGSHFALYGIKG
jgi:hypothetical protein